MEIKVFKIWDTERQLFFRGGSESNSVYRYGKIGKTWNQINHVKSCLKQHIIEKYLKNEDGTINWSKKEIINKIPESWEVVEFSSVTGEKRYPAKQLYPE